MDCQRARHTAFLLLDEEVEPGLLDPFREHLSRCPGCAVHRDYTLKLFSMVRERCQRLKAPQKLKAQILSSFPHRQTVATQVLE